MVGCTKVVVPRWDVLWWVVPRWLYHGGMYHSGMYHGRMYHGGMYHGWMYHAGGAMVGCTMLVVPRWDVPWWLHHGGMYDSGIYHGVMCYGGMYRADCTTVVCTMVECTMIGCTMLVVPWWDVPWCDVSRWDIPWRYVPWWDIPWWDVKVGEQSSATILWNKAHRGQQNKRKQNKHNLSAFLCQKRIAFKCCLHLYIHALVNWILFWGTLQVPLPEGGGNGITWGKNLSGWSRGRRKLRGDAQNLMKHESVKCCCEKRCCGKC